MSKLNEILDNLTTIQKILGVTAAIFVGVVTANKVFVELNSEIISQAVVEKAQKELNPVPLDIYKKHRYLDSLEQSAAIGIALNYMDRLDSMIIVLSPRLDRIEAKLSILETKQNLDTATTRDRQVAMIWQYLQNKELQDSTTQQLQSIMSEIKAGNKARIKAIKELKQSTGGDRIE